jgi:tRNA threonylcarbamoyladenosine biosynthesis protein TsaB
MAAAKAISLAVGVPVVSVDTLQALAATERYRRGTADDERSPSLIFPVLDARKSRFYAAAFRNDPELTRLAEDGDLTREELAEMIQRTRANGTDSWCAPGPITEILRDEPGYVTAATRHESAATGVALLGYQRLQRDAADTDYQGPFYLRTGDIGRKSSVPRFSPTTQESSSD